MYYNNLVQYVTRCSRYLVAATPSLCEYGDGWLETSHACWKIITDHPSTWHQARYVFISNSHNSH